MKARKPSKALKTKAPKTVIDTAMRVDPMLLALARTPKARPAKGTAGDPWKLPAPFPGVVPAAVMSTRKGAPSLAMDSASGEVMDFARLATVFSEGLAFLGYPYLAELSQRAEYRHISETIAKEMTRKWLKLHATGSDDKADKIKVIEKALKHFKVRDLFRRAAELDGLFGRAQIYIDTGSTDKAEVLKAALPVEHATIGIGGLKGLRIVEPTWTYPVGYNSNDPLSPDFYNPRAWYVFGKEVHASRFLTFVARPMPDLLKPAYMFGGLSLSQMAKPYVDNWIRTRQSVSDLIKSFSIISLAADMAAALAGKGGASLFDRVDLFNALRDNHGAMLTNKATEELTQLAVPLGTLDKLQAQAQEQMASVVAIPLVKLLGITPSGLNASSDGEIRVFYDNIHASQENLFDDEFTKVLDIIQLHLFGEIDPDIAHTWEPLYEMDDLQKSTIRKSDGDAAVAYIAAGVLSPADERQRLAKDAESTYPGLDVDALPPPPGGGLEDDDPIGGMALPDSGHPPRPDLLPGENATVAQPAQPARPAKPAAAAVA